MLVWTTGMSSSQGLLIDRMLTISSMLKDERVARDKERSWAKLCTWGKTTIGRRNFMMLTI
jgi:hypothetical protein